MNVDTGRYPCVESDLGVARYASAKCAPLESVNGFFEGFGDRAPGDTRVLIVGSHCFCGKEIVTTRRVLLYSDVTLPLQRYSVHTHTHTHTHTHARGVSLSLRVTALGRSGTQTLHSPLLSEDTLSLFQTVRQGTSTAVAGVNGKQ